MIENHLREALDEAKADECLEVYLEQDDAQDLIDTIEGLRKQVQALQASCDEKDGVIKAYQDRFLNKNIGVPYD